jgi:hypothetical protein
MVKMVLSDFASRKMGLAEDKQSKISYGIVGMMSILWGCNFSLQLGIETTAIFAFHWGILVLQSVFHKIYPTSLSPAMYLVPLTEQEKLSYLRYCFWVKIVGVNVLFSIGNIIFVLLGKITWQSGIAVILSFFMISIPMGVPDNRKRISGASKLSEYKKEDRNKWQEQVYISAACVNYGLLIWLRCEERNIWIKLVIAICFLIQVLLFPWILKNSQKKLKEAVTKENIWKMAGQ